MLWSSRRQSLIATSTCEAEYIALYDTVKLVQGAGYLSWLDSQHEDPIYFGDNQSSIAVANTTLPTKKTKHMLLRFHMVRQFAQDIAYCPTELNMADPLTKPMPEPLMFYQTPTAGTLPDTKAHGLLASYNLV